MTVPDCIKIITYFNEEDLSFQGDYESVEVWFDNNLMAQYGDYYHDKGDIKAESVVEGYLWGVEDKIEVQRINAVSKL